MLGDESHCFNLNAVFAGRCRKSSGAWPANAYYVKIVSKGLSVFFGEGGFSLTGVQSLNDFQRLACNGNRSCS